MFSTHESKILLVLLELEDGCLILELITIPNLSF